MQAHVHTLASPDHRTVADKRRATDVNTEAIDGQSALQGAHVVRSLTVAKYPPTDTTQGVTLTGKDPVKWQTPLKAGPSLRRAIDTRREARRR